MTSGVNVYPAEVEAVIDTVTSVADVAAVGGPDPERGEQVVAFIVPAPGTVGGDVVAAVGATTKGELAGYKRPRRIVLCAEVPRDPTGKLLRTRLRDSLWEGGYRISSSSSSGTT